MNKETAKKLIAEKLNKWAFPVAENKLDHVTVDSLQDYKNNKAALRQAADTVTIPTVDPTNDQASKTMPGVESESVVKEEEFQDPDLFDSDEEKAEREMNENEFDSVMEALSKKNGPVVDIAENINPRIKKGDLINYLANKTQKK